MKFLLTTLADDLPANPENWTAEQIMVCTAEAFLSVEERIRRALAHFKFKVVRIEQLPVHRIQIVHFSGNQNMGLYCRSLASMMKDAFLFHKLDFDVDSLVVSALGRQGRVVFISHEPLTGDVLLE